VQGVVRLATSAGPRLLKEGKIPEALARTGDSRAERTWRTVIGCDATGHRLVALMLARGRDGLPGATLREAAETLRELGATEGINLDGGSSSTVWYRHLKSELKPLFPLQSEIQHAIFIRKDLPVVTMQPQ
jgi:exopolysaccharide biosynthesis protein